MRYLKLLALSIFVFALFAGVWGAHTPAQAQDSEGFSVLAGASGPMNIDVLAFAPQNLKIHRGDTVTWYFLGFHNVHFEETAAALVIAPEVDGKPTPQINPDVAFPTIENGGTFTGDATNTGLVLLDPNSPPVFTLTFDVEPGMYTYFCDVHPGMFGTVEVVADDVEIPSPMDQVAIAMQELGAQVGAGMGAAGAMMEHSAMAMPDDSGNLEVRTGAYGMQASSQMFFPSVAVIEPGQTVTWVIGDDNIDPHTITSANSEGEEFVFVPPAEEGGAPTILAGGLLLPAGQNGASVGTGDTFQSGLIGPGETFSITFDEPGVYQYNCTIHPGMTGVVVVMPPMEGM